MSQGSAWNGSESRAGAAPKLSTTGGGLLVLDTSYTLEMIQERGLDATILCRDLDGFFDHVWSVHPFATLLTSGDWAPKYGKPAWHRFSPRHTVIEGTIGRYGWLRGLSAVNFLLSQVGLFLSLMRLIRSRGIKVIRVGDPLYLGLFGLALSRASGLPLAMRLNGNNAKVRKNTGAPIFPRLFRSSAVEEAIERFVFKRTDLVAALNAENLEFALASGARKEFTTLFRLGNLISPEHLEDPATRGPDFPVVQTLGLTPGKYLLTIGRLEPLKFPEDVIRVHHFVRQKGWDVQLVFAGDGSLRAAVEALAAELGTRGSVIFAENRSQAELAQLIPSSAAVVSPFMGRALTEAAFGAAPVVAYDTDWQAELIETGVTGELVPFRDWRAMAEGVLKLLGNRVLAAAMGTALRRRALEMMDPAALNDHERREYSNLLKRFRLGGGK